MFLTYCIVGVLGYIGFVGVKHKDFLKDGKITSNFLQMFDYTDPAAILVRFLLFIQLTCAYPLVNHF